ncbi:MAG: GAF domain-containing protein [Polyangiaceae bacterium]
MSETPLGSAEGKPAEAKASVRSDPPPEDLKRERDAFIQQFFRRGAQLSEELLSDIGKLREQVRGLEAENARLRAQVASDDAIRELLRKIENLEEEKRVLVAHAHRSPISTDEFSSRFGELERELDSLGMLHVANVQLHAATSVRRAFRSLRELLAQFLGAAQFAVFWEVESPTPGSSVLVPISTEGLSTKEARDFLIDDSPAAAAYTRSQLWSDTSADPSHGSIERPAVVIPLSMAQARVGAIVIFRTMPQKVSFDSADIELFKLLSTQAAPAIVHAHLFAQSGRKTPGVQAFIDQED